MNKILLGTFIAFVGAALQWFFWSWIEPSLFILLYPVVIISSLLGGLFTGIITTFASMFLAAYIFYPPAFSFNYEHFISEPMPFIVFLITGISIAVIVNKMQQRTFDLAREKSAILAQKERSRFFENMFVGFTHCEMIFDENNDPVDFIYKDANSAYKNLIGFNNIVGRKLSEVLPGLRASHPELLQLYGRVASGGAPETIKIYIPLLKKWLSIRAYYYEVKNHFAAVFDDITNEKMVEEGLRVSEERFRFMIEQSPLSIQVLDTLGNTIKISKSFEKLWGLRFDDLKNYNMLQDQQLERIGLMSYIKRGFSGETVTLPLREYDATDTLGKGLKRLISSSIYPVKDYQGSVINVVLVHEDVTEQEMAKAAILEAKEAAENAARLKSHFLDIAAHELRTPVTSLSLLIQMAQRQLAKNYPVDELILKRLRSQVDRISRLVIDLLDVSRLERNALTLQWEKKDLVSLIMELVDDFKLLRPNREIVFRGEHRAVEVELDPVRIHQVISNLLNNAIKYTPDASPIEISIEMKDGRVRVCVRDYGPGIPADQHLMLFKPFTRGTTQLVGRSGGLGLGLYVSRLIIELHGGEIGIESRPGPGSTFYFELPILRGERNDDSFKS